MMQVARESQPFIGTPVLEPHIERPAPEDRFLFRYLTNDRVEVRHPFHGPVILGDRSAFPDSAVDDAMVLMFQKFPFMVDSMKLNRTRRFETHIRAGEYGQLSHGFSLACIARAMGSGPLEQLQAALNDLSHTMGGHGDEDMFQDHGEENLHDKLRKSLFDRSGFLQQAVDLGIFQGPNLLLRGTKRSSNDFLEEQVMKTSRSLLNNDHKARRMDADRFQYNEQEDYETGRTDRANTDKSLEKVVCLTVAEGGEGEQLVYTDEDVALSASERYMRKNAEHWMEPFQDCISDTTAFLKWYLFVSPHPLAKMYFQEFAPRDYLYRSAAEFYRVVDQIAADDPVVNWLVTKIEQWGEHQRGVMAQYNETNLYSGPQPPDGIILEKMNVDSPPVAQVWVADGKLHFVLPPGKERTIDPRVLNNDGTSVPISKSKKEEFGFYKHHYGQWIGAYKATIEINDPEMERLLAEAIDLVSSGMEAALSRPEMPPERLQEQITEANDFVCKYGRIALIAA